MDRQVQLYVSTTSYQNITTSVVNTFYNNVTANGGVCESGQCMIDYLESLGGIYGNLASAERLELFNDEQIQVTSTVQNVQDISKTFKFLLTTTTTESYNTSISPMSML